MLVLCGLHEEIGKVAGIGFDIIVGTPSKRWGRMRSPAIVRSRRVGNKRTMDQGWQPSDGKHVKLQDTVRSSALKGCQTL